MDGFADNVQFVGRLVIEDLRWLSTRGYEQLQRELQDRDIDTNNLRDSGLTLSAIYGYIPGEGSRVTIWLLCNKGMTATFLTCTVLLPTDCLLLTSFDVQPTFTPEAYSYNPPRRKTTRSHLLTCIHINAVINISSGTAYWRWLTNS